MSTRLLPGIQRGAIPLELNVPRVLFFDHAATWLLIQRYGNQFIPELYVVSKDRKLELKSMDALVYFLWAAVQRDAKETGRPFTIEDAEEQLQPFTYIRIFNGVVLALTAAMAQPVQAGKASAISAAAAPVVETDAATPKDGSAKRTTRQLDLGPTRASTSTTRSGSPSPSSTGPRRRSGK